MAKVIKSSDRLEVGGIFGILYGEDGIGKTTLSMTTNNCVVAMYDTGFKRSLGRKDAVAFNDWNDIVDYFDVHSNYRAQGRPSPLMEDFPNIKTVIHDTAGILLDKFLSPHVRKIKSNRRGDGSLSLQGYGAIKHNFGYFLSALERDGLNHIFVCHVSVPEDGEGEQKLRPRMAGGSYNLLMERADLCGFIERNNKGRVLSFDSDERKVGKNTGRILTQQVPEYGTQQFSSFFQNCLNQTRKQMEELASPPQNLLDFQHKLENATDIEELDMLEDGYPEEARFCGAELQGKRFYLWQQKAMACASVEEFNSFIQEAKDSNPPKKRELFQTLMDCAKQAGLIYDKGLFADPEAQKESKEEPKQRSKPKPAPRSNNGDQRIISSIEQSIAQGVGKDTLQSLYLALGKVKSEKAKAETKAKLDKALNAFAE